MRITCVVECGGHIKCLLKAKQKQTSLYYAMVDEQVHLRCLDEVPFVTAPQG